MNQKRWFIRIYADLLDKTKSYNGTRYYVVFKDNASEYRCICAIRGKADVFEKFVQYPNVTFCELHDFLISRTTNKIIF